jgi:hypothetical protein
MKPMIIEKKVRRNTDSKKKIRGLIREAKNARKRAEKKEIATQSARG